MALFDVETKDLPIYEIGLSGSFIPILNDIDGKMALQLTDPRFVTHGKSALLFHSPGCPHCRDLMAALYKMAKATKGNISPIGTINVFDENSGGSILRDYFQVKAFPTMMVHAGGQYKLFGIGTDEIDLEKLFAELGAEIVGANLSIVHA